MWPFPMESAHPLVVHFPIALLLTAASLELFGWALNRPSLHRVSLWNLGLGACAAGVAVFTGLRAAELAKHTFEIHQVMERHRQLGIATAVLAAIIVGGRLMVRDRLSRRLRSLSVVLLLLMSGIIAYGAHLGGRLVYEFGVGGTFGRPPVQSHETHEHVHP